MRFQLIPVMLAFALQVGAQARIAPREMTSSWTVARDSLGAEKSRTITNRRFEFGGVMGSKYTDVLFVEEVRTTVLRTEEGDHGRVTVEAWAREKGDTTYSVKLWRIDAPGSQAAFDYDHMLITQAGCCGASPTHTRFSVRTGTAVVSFTDEPVSFQRSDGLGSYGVYFMNSNGVVSSNSALSARGAVGELTLVRNDSVRARVVLTSSKPAYVGPPTPAVTITNGKDTGLFAYLTKGERASVCLKWEDGATVIIPVIETGFVLPAAQMPAWIHARVIP